MVTKIEIKKAVAEDCTTTLLENLNAYFFSFLSNFLIAYRKTADLVKKYWLQYFSSISYSASDTFIITVRVWACIDKY